MSSSAQINREMEELAEVVGLPKEQLEYVAYGERLDEGIEKFTRNLSRCLESFKEQLQRHEANKSK